jgi:putative sugar O-methyltransferase
MNTVIKILLSWLLCMTVYTLGAIEMRQFNMAWECMQKNYLKLQESLTNKGFNDNDKKYCHPHWFEAKEHVKRLICSSPNIHFLKDRVIESTMVPHGMGLPQRYELCMLQDCLDDVMREKIANFREPDTFLPQECKEYNCSTNALNKLTYAAKVQSFIQSPRTIIEFGGGYGCLAHIFKKCCPLSTIVLIDLPEFLAIQHLYLQIALPHDEIIVHTEVPETLKEGAIHLVPVHFLSELSVAADLFISTFALSETPLTVQEMVFNKQFFHAQVCYIIGQLDGWEGKFENHIPLHSAVRKLYKTVSCIPFYYTLEVCRSYEIVGLNK